MDTHLCHQQGKEEDLVFWDIMILQEWHSEWDEELGDLPGTTFSLGVGFAGCKTNEPPKSKLLLP